MTSVSIRASRGRPVTLEAAEELRGAFVLRLARLDFIACTLRVFGEFEGPSNQLGVCVPHDFDSGSEKLCLQEVPWEYFLSRFFAIATCIIPLPAIVMESASIGCFHRRTWGWRPALWVRFDLPQAA